MWYISYAGVSERQVEVIYTREHRCKYLLSRKQDKNIPLSLLFPPICSPPLISLFFHRLQYLLQIIYPILFLTCKGKFMAVSSTMFEVLSLDSLSDTFRKRSVFRASTYWESMLSICWMLSISSGVIFLTNRRNHRLSFTFCFKMVCCFGYTIANERF